MFFNEYLELCEVYEMNYQIHHHPEAMRHVTTLALRQGPASRLERIEAVCLAKIAAIESDTTTDKVQLVGNLREVTALKTILSLI